METSFKYFLMVAEELNISKAASKAFITQQSMSTHMKKLEEDLRVTLFNRKPRLSLTAEGEMLANTLYQIKLLEESYTLQINDQNTDYRGSLNIGISNSRASLIMSDAISKYKQRWHNIDITLQYDYMSENMENRIIRGYMDIFVGISEIHDRDNINIISLHDENIYIVISDNLAKQYFLTQKIDRKNKSRVIPLSCFADIPFITNTEGEISYKIYSQYFNNNNVQLNSIVNSDDARLRAQLCSLDLGAGIMTELMLMNVLEYNKTAKHNKLHYYPIRGLSVPSIIAFHKKKPLTTYMKHFVDIIAEETTSRYENLNLEDTAYIDAV